MLHMVLTIAYTDKTRKIVQLALSNNCLALSNATVDKLAAYLKELDQDWKLEKTREEDETHVTYGFKRRSV
jgi:hypothetical protein